MLNTGLVLPAVRELWASGYGRVVILTVVALVPALVRATFHRTTLRRAAERIGVTLVGLRTVRAEAALALLVALGGSILALLAPPGVKAVPVATMVDLVAPAAGIGQPGGVAVRLQVQPARSGANAVVVRLTDTAGEPLPPDLAPIRIDAVGLDHAGELLNITPFVDASGAYSITGVGLGGTGWWRFNVNLYWPGQPVEQVPFYLLFPDPNVHGMEAPDTSKATDEATAVFGRGLEHLAGLHRVRWNERLGGGTGTVVVAEQAISDGSDGRPPAFSVTGAGSTLIHVGDREWLRRAGGAWIEREAGPVISPLELAQEYARAEGMRLGRVEVVDGEPCQIVTFVLPATGLQEPSWFAWWVGTESGHVRQMAMVARAHYMVRSYRDFDAPIAIVPPADAGLPGSPIASPAAGGG